MVADEAAERRGLAAAWRIITLVVMGILGVGVLIALILTLGEATKQRNRAISLQSHSYDVMVLARTLSGTIARSEASLGRYVISGDQQLGRLYYEDWRRAGDQIARLAKLSRDNETQQPLMASLQRAYQARGEQLSLIALSTNYGKNAQALSRYYQARESAALDEINRALDAIITGERALLVRRTDAAMALVERSTRAAFVLSAFGVLLLLGSIALGWLSVRALTGRARAQAEADFERARAGELAVAVAEATAELQIQEAQLRQAQKMDAIGQLTGGIAHDFNNMLAVVIGGLELAQRGLANGTRDVGRHVESAREGATRAAELTRRLLAFAREGAIDPEAIDVGALLAGMRDLLDRTLGDGVRVEIADTCRGACVRADRVQLENAILNLAVNARDAMEGRGTLTITATLDRTGAADRVMIAVTDTGCGMPPDVAERVFEPFFTTKPLGKGTGLGLSQVFSLVKQFDGDVALDSAPGTGTTVRISLPHNAPALPPSTGSDTTSATPTRVQSLTVLVVEDDPRVLAATTGALTELGHQPVACSDPFDAPALLDRHTSVDLIVSDVLMPGQTGPEMVAALDYRHSDIPVLFVTGFAGETSDPAAFGGHHVLRKPFTLLGLEQAIGEAMSRRRPDIAHGIAAE